MYEVKNTAADKINTSRQNKLEHNKFNRNELAQIKHT